MTTNDDLQEAADRGELRSQRNESVQRNLAQLERRWIIMQVVEIAKASPLTPDQFRDLCEFIRGFTGAQ